MTLKAWQVLNRRIVFRGGPIQEVAIETVQLPDGQIIDDYYALRLSDYVLVYPEMDDGTVTVLRQYRHGLRRECLGFPGGAIEDGESPLATAQRELLEELGYVAREWQSLGAVVSNGNQHGNTAHLFKATGCTRIAPPGAPDMERPEIVTVDVRTLLESQAVLHEFGLASHVALLLMVTHPALAGGRQSPHV